MKLTFKPLGYPKGFDPQLWNNWKWQLRNLGYPFKCLSQTSFPAGATPYYSRMIHRHPILMPIIQVTNLESTPAIQGMKDPLGEEEHSPYPRLIHRYPDRVLFLLTDQCGVYCRFCTRKRFTGKKQALVSKSEQREIFDYIKSNPGVREVILSGGDPLTLSDAILQKTLQNLRSIEHIEIIRIASRMPVVCPMRLTDSLIEILKSYQPVFLMTHFNHPLELSEEVQKALIRVADSGILMFNQTVLLHDVNNHPAIIQALMRRLLYLRVKPYYMFQCDPSEGSSHFQTDIQNSQWIQRELWGRFSGLAMPNLSLDIPGGGGKVGLVPDFVIKKTKREWTFKGWDGLKASYIQSLRSESKDFFKKNHTEDLKEYKKEWEILRHQTYGYNF